MTKRRFTLLGHWIDIEVRRVKPIRYCDESCLPWSPLDSHVNSHRLPGDADLDMGDYILRAGTRVEGNYVRVSGMAAEPSGGLFLSEGYFTDGDVDEALKELGK